MSWDGPSRKIDEVRREIDPEYQTPRMKELGVSMHVPGRIFADDAMWERV